MTLTFSDYAARLRDFIDRSTVTDPPSSPDSEFNELALSLFALQFAENAPYRQFCKSRGVTPESIGHWSGIPAIPAAAFKELELTSLPSADREVVFHSSGTTEHRPARHFHNTESLALYEASLLAWFRVHALSTLNSQLSTFLSLTPSSSVAPHSSLVHMFSTVHRELGTNDSIFTGRLDNFSAWDVDCGSAITWLRRAVAAAAPVIIMGTAFNFLQFLDYLDQFGIKLNLPAGTCALETGGYKGRARTLPKSELHSLITKRLGIPAHKIISEYGMCELSSQAYDLKLSTCFHFPPWARAQIISPETGREVADGETGLIRIFDLANLHSVLALQTEDLGTRRGNGFELLGRAALAETRGCSLMSL